MFRLALKDQDWDDKSHGYAQLTVKPEGVSGNDDNNICFTFKTASDLKVTYKPAVEEEPLVFTVEGDFYVPVKKDLYLVPNFWSNDDAKIAAWTWGKELGGEWTSFFAPKAEANDTLVAKVNAAADSIIFVRFNSAATEPKWNGGDGYQWNQTPNDSIQWEKGIFTIIGCEGYNCNGTWDVYVPEVPATFYVTGDSALVVDAGLEKAQAWNPAAIKSMADTLVLNLKAGVAYQMSLTVDGSWNTKKTFEDLTKPATAGLNDVDGDNHNIGFTLNEDGEVKVVYFVKGEEVTFKVLGDFYVAPVEKKYYIKNNWGAGSEWTWKEMTKDEEDSYYLQAVFGGTGVNINTAESEAGQLWFEAKDIPAFLNDDYYTETTLEAKDTVIFFYTPSEEMLAALVIGKYVPATPILADGFYLVGTFNNVDAWNLSDLTADKLFTATDVEGQYSIDVTLTAGDRFKAIKVENEALIQWYPTGSDNDYVVDASHAGQKTIYFRPDFWQEWNGHFYVEPNQGEGINNVEVVEAVKVLRNGQILIIKGNKTFNVQGQLVK